MLRSLGQFPTDPFSQTWGSGYGGSYSFTGGWAYPSAAGYQISVGQILEDLGDWIKTTAGDVLRVVVDEFGRRIIQKTGEVISRTPLGPATAYAYAERETQRYLPWLAAGGVVLAAILLTRR